MIPITRDNNPMVGKKAIDLRNTFLQNSFRVQEPLWCEFVYVCSNSLACCSKVLVNLSLANYKMTN